ncbi:MAG: hypothetical protein QT02_C0003G0015 [archaeon GW2011_AR9]|nr:MAG: hypothetical protein QT02_C0003G0015 [archaeon GW2011_AR9]MBS3120938.1 hypothetical protein [Candidatus Woesearchaeota archaeon]HIH12368.1 hypothetical protein [Candidatus Woesearchaeota archaeon]
MDDSENIANENIAKLGRMLYTTILEQNQALKLEHQGETIWIDTITGKYELGEGIPAVNRLIEKLQVPDGRNFYSRRIGLLDTF